MTNNFIILLIIVVFVLFTANTAMAGLLVQSGTFINFSYLYFISIPSLLFFVLMSAVIGFIFHRRFIVTFHLLGAFMSFFVVSLFFHILPIGDERAISFFYYDVFFLSLFYATLLTLIVFVISVIGRRFERFRSIQNRINRLNDLTKTLMVFVMYVAYITPIMFSVKGVFHYYSIRSEAGILLPLFGAVLFFLVMFFLIVPLYKKTKKLVPDIPTDDKRDYLFFLLILFLFITVGFLMINYYPSYPILGGPPVPQLIEIKTPDGEVYFVYDNRFHERVIDNKMTYYLEKEIGQDAQGRTIKEKVVVHGDEVRRYQGTDEDLRVSFLYEIGGKLTYGLLKDGKEYIVHGDKQIGSEYDSVSYRNFFEVDDKIVFRAKKDNKELVVHGDEVISDKHGSIIQFEKFYDKILYCYRTYDFKNLCVYDGIQYDYIFASDSVRINDKLIFVAIREGKYFVVLDNRQISEKYNIEQVLRSTGRPKKGG